MEVRRVTREDYLEIAGWWKSQGKEILSWDALPTMSFLVEDGNEKIVVAWLYASDSTVGFVGWTTINSAIHKKKVAVALRELDMAIEISAAQIGRTLLFRFSGGGGFSRLLLKLGWRDSLVKHDLLLREI